MSSRSSSSAPGPERLLTIGKVRGHRGRDGEITVLVGEDATNWLAVRRVVIEGRAGAGRVYEVQSSRGYRDRLVLRLRGVDDGNEAARLRGSLVKVAWDDVPRPPEGQWYRETLEGMRVEDERGEPLGRVREVVPTGGADLLVVVRDGSDDETLIPLVGGIVVSVDELRGSIVVRPPDGLLALNREGGDDDGR